MSQLYSEKVTQLRNSLMDTPVIGFPSGDDLVGNIEIGLPGPSGVDVLVGNGDFVGIVRHFER